MRKKIIYSISLVLIILVSIYLGYFLTMKLNLLTVNPGERTDLVQGWHLFLRGEIKEIADNYLILAAGNEEIKLNFSSERTRFYSVRPTEERSVLLQEKGEEPIDSTELFNIANQPAELKDFKVGDKISSRANLFQNELYALTILKTK